MKKMLFVFNPHSGKALIKNKLLDIVNIFTGAGYEITIYPTQRALDGYDRVCEADGKYDLIVCSGGDGTINEVLAAVMQLRKEKPVIGYIPAGSTNDFARSLGIPTDMIKAASLIENGKTCNCDIGCMNGHYFNYIAAFGLFTEVSYKTPQAIKNILGHQAYFLESVKSITNIKTYEMEVYCDEGVYIGRYIYGMISNSTSIGGFKGISGREVALDDGKFEVVLVKAPEDFLQLNEAVLAVFGGRYVESDMVIRFKTSHMVMVAKEAVAWTLDGENGDEHERVEIDVIPNAVKIICGDAKSLQGSSEDLSLSE